MNHKIFEIDPRLQDFEADFDLRKKNLQKLDEYRRNGIYPGKNLIITYEAEGSYLNIKEIRQMVKEIFGEN